MLWAFGSVRSFSAPNQDVLGNLLSFNLGGAASALACLLALPASAVGAVPGAAAWQATLPALAALALLFVLPSTLLLVWATQQLPAPRVGILMMTEIIAGTVTAALLANEPFGARQMAGSLLIVAAGILDVSSRVPSKPPPSVP